MEAKLKVSLSGAAIVEAVSEYLRSRLAPGCVVEEVWAMPPGEDGAARFEADVSLPGKAEATPPLSEQWPAIDGGAAVAEDWDLPGPLPPVTNDPGPEFVTSTTEARTLEDEELEQLQERDPVSARRARRERARRRQAERREARHAEG